MIIVKQPVAFSQSLTLCNGQTITVGTNTYTTTGIYTDLFVASNGCDSSVTTNLTVTRYYKTQNLTLCAGQSVVVGTHNYNVSGTYVDNLFAINGCDSMVTTNLTVLLQIHFLSR